MPIAHAHLEPPTMSTLSPAEAATRVGCSRRSIMRAIEEKKLIASRDNHNQWRIEADALAQWAPTGRAQAIAHPAPTPAHVVHELQTRVAVLEAELGGERRRADTAEATLGVCRKDRDAWRDQAQQLARAQKPKGWTLFKRAGAG